MDRRRFLKTTASPPDLAVAKGPSAERIIRVAVDALGGILLLTGAVLLFSNKAPFLGKLPGDLLIKRGTVTLFFPLATGIVLSLLVSLVLYLIRKVR